jgi:hypothetical protein
MSQAETKTISNPWVEYMQDAMERSVLFMDVLRQRGNNYEDRIRSVAPNVLTFNAELISRRPRFRAPGQLRSGPDHPARKRGDRPEKTPLHRLRSARRARAGHRRHET